MTILCTPPPFLLGDLLNFRKGGARQDLNFERRCWKRWGYFFQRGGKLKSEIFYDKKLYKRKYFSLT